jgi:anti-sigma factor RsiW
MSAHVETELLAYLDGELTVSERVRVEAHLADCPQCTAELDRLRLLQRELSATLDTALAR